MVKSLNATVDRWQRKVSVAEQDYLLGVQNPTKDWQQEALRAEQSYDEGVLAAMQQRSWANGVSQVSTQEWQRKTLEKSPRWRQGVGVAGQDYAQSMQVVLQNVESAVNDMDRSVGPRGAKGSEQNIQRSVAFQRGMHQRTLAARGQTPATGGLVMEAISVDRFGRSIPPSIPPTPGRFAGLGGNTEPAPQPAPAAQPLAPAPTGRRYNARSF